MTLDLTFNSLEEMKKFCSFIAGQDKPIQEAGQETEAVTFTAPSAVSALTPEVQSQPSAATAAAPVAVPTTQPSYTSDDLAKAAVALVDANRKEELQALLQNFGVASLPALPQERYGEFATALRSMGAPI